MPSKLFLLSLSLLFILFLYTSERNLHGFKPKKDKAFLFLIPLLAILTLNTAFSLDPLHTLFGSHIRYNGVFTWLNYLICFYLGYIYNTQSADGDTPYILKPLAIAISILGIISIFQALGYDLVPRVKGSPTFGLYRAAGTFETASFFGSFLVLAIPVLLSYIKKSKYIFISVLLGTLALLFTFSRGAWIGLLVGLAAFIWLNLKEKKWRRAFIACSLILLLISGYFLTFSFGRTRTVLKRIEFWKVCSKLISHKPLTGYGADNLAIAFPQGITESYERNIKLITKKPHRATIIDRAHNLFIDLPVDFGIPFLLFFLWILIYYSLNFLKQSQKETNFFTRQETGEAIGLLSYKTSLLFHFISPDIAPLSFFLLGRGVAPKAESQNLLNQRKERDSDIKIENFMLLILSLNTLIFFTQMVSSYHFQTSIREISKGNINESLKSIRIAEKLTFWEPELNLIEGKFLLNFGAKKKDLQIIDQGIAAFKTAARKSPYDERSYFELGNSYLIKYEITKRPEFLILAEKYYHEVEEIDPNNAELNLRKGIVAFYKKNYQQAREEWERGYFLAPNSKALLQNLANVYKILGDKSKYLKVKKELKKL